MISSNMAVLPLLREPGFLCRRWNVASVRRSRPGRGFNFSASLWRSACNFLDRPCDAAQRCAEIGDIDHGKQQPRYPEQVDVRKERQQAQDGYDLELQFLRLVRHALRQAMQPQI